MREVRETYTRQPQPAPHQAHDLTSTPSTPRGAVTSPAPQPTDTTRGAPILSPRTLKNIRPSSHIYEVYTGEPNKSLTKHPPPPPASDPHPLTSWEPATPREHPATGPTPSRHHPGHQIPRTSGHRSKLTGPAAVHSNHQDFLGSCPHPPLLLAPPPTRRPP